MSKSCYITAAGHTAEKAPVVLAALGLAAKLNDRVGYFKPVVASADEEQFKAALAEAKLTGDSSAYFGLTVAEVYALLNQGKEGDILDAVLAKYNALAGQCDMIVIEGLDRRATTSGALSDLDATLAANLGSPVLLLTSEPCCADAVAVAVGAFKRRYADVLAVGIISQDPSKFSTVANLAPLADTQVLAVSSIGELAAQLEKTPPCKMAFAPSAVTPKRFEFNLIAKAKLDKRHIVLPEGNDERVLRAADDILGKDFANLTILGDPDEMNKQAQALGLKNLSKANLLNHKTSPMLKELAEAYYELRKAKGVTLEKAEIQMQDRNYFATMMIKQKKADGMVSGADGTTADTIRPALSIIKTKPGCSIASSVFLMCLADRVWVFGDCAINTNPTPQHLAEIAVISAQTAQAFGVDPKVAMLSYSTGKSGHGPDIEAVVEATKLAQEAAEKIYPGLPVDGPLQFDAAVDPRTAKSKMPGSPVAGQATVMIFPDLNSGNIGYKAVQRTANAVAIGPIIQGLKAPVNDLSRGCLVADIVNTVAITALQAQAEK